MRFGQEIFDVKRGEQGERVALKVHCLFLVFVCLFAVAVAFVE